MDADRFDRWTRLLAMRISRRTAVAGLGAAAVATLAAPRWTLGQDDDEDPETDVDQHKDNPTGEDPDDEGQTEGNGGDDTSDDGQVGDPEYCLPITRCKIYKCTDNTGMDGSGECHFEDVAEIPAGPFPQYWDWKNCPNCCTPVGWSWADLEAICNRAYKDRCAMGVFGGCNACTDFSLFNCH